MPTTLLCLPYAGAGPSAFFPWRRFPFPDLFIVPLSLPGRERRLDEEPFGGIPEAADRLTAEVRALGAEGPVALYGHSMGAVLAYEITRRLEEQGSGTVAHLFVSGSESPWDQRTQQATGLSDDDFVAQVESFAGFRHEAFKIPELRDMLLPTLRADVEMHEAYSPPVSGVTSVPVTSLRGTGDSLVSRQSVDGWSRTTTGSHVHHEVDGDHMFITTAPETLLEVVSTWAGQGAQA